MAQKWRFWLPKSMTTVPNLPCRDDLHPFGKKNVQVDDVQRGVAYHELFIRKPSSFGSLCHIWIILDWMEAVLNCAREFPWPVAFMMSPL